MNIDTLADKALNFLKYLTAASWNTIFKFVVIASLLFIGVELRQSNNFIQEFWQEKKVIVPQEARQEVDEALSDLMRDISEIQGIAVYVYQPETFPKTKSELLTVKLRESYTNSSLHAKLHSKAILHINVPLYRELARNDYISLPSPDYKELSSELEYDAQVTNANIYGLYHFGAVGGSVVVMFKLRNGRREPSKADLKQIYLGVRYINSVIYER